MSINFCRAVLGRKHYHIASTTRRCYHSGNLEAASRHRVWGAFVWMLRVIRRMHYPSPVNHVKDGALWALGPSVSSVGPKHRAEFEGDYREGDTCLCIESSRQIFVWRGWSPTYLLLAARCRCSLAVEQNKCTLKSRVQQNILTIKPGYFLIQKPESRGGRRVSPSKLVKFLSRFTVDDALLNALRTCRRSVAGRDTIGEITRRVCSSVSRL